MAGKEVRNIWNELVEMRKQLTQLNDKSTMGTDHSGLTTSPPIKPSEPIDDKGGLVKHISTQTDTSTNLCTPDLNDVLQTLKTKGCDFDETRWMDLGLALGLYMSTLKSIKSNCGNNSHECLMETLDKWLRKADNVVSKVTSWDTLADALRSINENRSAQYITEQRMRLEALSASNDAVRDGAIINVVKDASQSLVDQNMMKINELMEKMESLIASQPEEVIDHYQLKEMKKEIKQLNEINEKLKLYLDELNQLKCNFPQEIDLAKKEMSHDLDKYRSSYKTVQDQFQSEIRELIDTVLKQLKTLNIDITHQLETKTKQLEELTETHMTTKSELDELKQKELEMEGKILSLSHQLREREEEVKQLSTDIKDLQFQSEKNKSLKEMSDKVESSVYSILVKEVPPPNRNDTVERKRRVKWDKSGRGSVTLTSPTPSDCITLIHQISIDRRPCEVIKLHSSSTDSTIILLSQLHQTSVKELAIHSTHLKIECLHCLCHLININQLEHLCLEKTSLSTSGRLHLLTDAISTNMSLGELWLLNDRLTEDDMVNICQALKINTTLQGLHMIDCNITDDGLVQLSNGLTQNKTLKELDISYNELITSTTAVCDIIHNSSLTRLYLTNTSLPSDSIPQLLDALSTNNTIERLAIDERHKARCEQQNYQDGGRIVFY